MVEPGAVVVLRASTAEETEEIGARLARAWPRQAENESAANGGGSVAQTLGPAVSSGDADTHSGDAAVIYLTGDLGAGKTTLTRGFLRALGAQGSVRSPTYTLVEFYELGGLTALHLDLYRLREPSELDELGLRDWAKPHHVWLIEWPDRGAGRLPGADLSLELRAGDEAHQIQMAAGSALGQRWLARLEGVDRSA